MKRKEKENSLDEKKENEKNKLLEENMKLKRENASLKGKVKILTLVKETKDKLEIKAQKRMDDLKEQKRKRQQKSVRQQGIGSNGTNSNGISLAGNGSLKQDRIIREQKAELERLKGELLKLKSENSILENQKEALELKLPLKDIRLKKLSKTVDLLKDKLIEMAREQERLEDSRETEIKIIGLAEKRGPAKVAQTLYEESEESIRKRSELAALRRYERLSSAPNHRPDKRGRRQLRRLQRGDE